MIQEQAVLDILEKAKTLIQERGWGRLSNWDYRPDIVEPCNFCMMGAVLYACDKLNVGAYDEDALGILRMFLPAPYHHSVVQFNDDPNRTKDEVLAVFTTAIDHTRAQIETA